MDSGLAAPRPPNDEEEPKGRFDARPRLVAAPAACSRYDAGRRSRVVAAIGHKCGRLSVARSRAAAGRRRRAGRSRGRRFSADGGKLHSFRSRSKSSPIATNSTSQQSAMWCHSFMFTSSRAAEPTKLWPKPVFGVTPLPRTDAAKFERFIEKVRKSVGAAPL